MELHPALWAAGIARQFAFFGIACSLCGLAHGEEDRALAPSSITESATLKRILANWAARQEGSRTFHLRWETHLPRQYVVHNEFWMEGNDRYRFETFAAATTGQQRAFDGMTTTILVTPPGQPDARHGIVCKGQSIPARSIPGSAGPFGWPFAPLVIFRPLAVGPLLEHPGRAGRALHLVTENAIFENEHFLQIRWRSSSDSPIWYTAWLHPARRNILVHFEESIRGDPCLWTTFRYRRDDRHGWVPTEWVTKNVQFRPPFILKETVTALTIDEPLPAKTFTVRFPAGTEVCDKDAREHYVVARDGSKANIVRFGSVGALEVYDLLERKTDFTIDPQPLKDALDFISTRFQVTIEIDKMGFHKASLDPAVEVQSPTRGIKVRELLTSLLSRCTKPVICKPRNGVLFITPLASSSPLK
jgi:hypothetical protein